MVDFNTAVQTALTPVVTIPVIAALAISIVAQAYFDARRMKARLRAQAERFGKVTGKMLSVLAAKLTSDAEREVGRAIEFTYDTLKGIGFDKLAKGDVTFEGIMFGGTPFKSESLRRRPLRDNPFDEPFSLDELREALRPKADGGTVLRPGEGPRGEKYTGGDPFAGEGNGGAPAHEDALNRERKGDQKGRRPYHAATDLDSVDFGGRSPRAG